MNKNNKAPSGAWSQPGPRAQMLAEVELLHGLGLVQRLSISYNKPGHIDDEVVATLALGAWHAGSRKADTFASLLLRRVEKHVRAHVSRNPGWQRLGGGDKSAADDFGQEVVLAMLADKNIPCHAEVAFGDYVYCRCLDQAGKLYAKKFSAGQSLDDDVSQALSKDAEFMDSAAQQSPEDLFVELEKQWETGDKLERIREIVQSDLLPAIPRAAFTYRYYGNMKIESKNRSEVTVTSLLGVTEKTATKYINQAIELIVKRLNNDEQ